MGCGKPSLIKFFAYNDHGVPTGVKKAYYVVSTMLHEHPHKENPPLEEFVYVSSYGLFCAGALVPFPPQGNPQWSRERSVAPAKPSLPFAGHRNEPFGFDPRNAKMSEEFSTRILCATGRIGGVIGKGRVTIKLLEHQAGAKIQVEDTDPAAEERIIIVTPKEISGNKTVAEEALFEVASRLRTRTMRPGNALVACTFRPLPWICSFRKVSFCGPTSLCMMGAENSVSYAYSKVEEQVSFMWNNVQRSASLSRIREC